MRPRAPLALTFALASTLAAAAAPPDPVPARLEVVSPMPLGVIATGINGGGDVVGFEWVEDPKTPGVVEQKPFFARGKEVTYLPLLKGYTATFPAAVSDGGLVAGRAGKPAAPGV